MSSQSKPLLTPKPPGPAVFQTALAPGDDMTVVGFPCQPYSRQRSGKGRVPADGHALADVTQKVIAGLLRLLPKTFVVENVLGFGDRDEDDGPSHAEAFKEALAGHFHILIVEIPLTAWVEAERVRPAPHVGETQDINKVHRNNLKHHHRIHWRINVISAFACIYVHHTLPGHNRSSSRTPQTQTVASVVRHIVSSTSLRSSITPAHQG
jgi:hypothetical protein